MTTMSSKKMHCLGIDSNVSSRHNKMQAQAVAVAVYTKRCPAVLVLNARSSQSDCGGVPQRRVKRANVFAQVGDHSRLAIHLHGAHNVEV